MRVLWLCNIMLPVIAKHLGVETSNKEGWLAGLSDQMREQNAEIELGVCFPYGQKISGRIDGLTYYGFIEDTTCPERYDEALEDRFKEILQDFQPDVVHCFGTEYPHTLAMVRTFGRPMRTLIGIQGLCFVYADAYMDGLPQKVRGGATFRDLIKKDTLKKQQNKFRMRGNYEIEAIRLTAHVTGRTDWDRFWTAKTNPGMKYHFMNETLRGCFYDGSVWSLDKCQKHSIFMSQGDYPIKGLHYMLEALGSIKKEYPDVHLYVAGNCITSFQTWKDKAKISKYGAYLRELIKQGQLEKNVTFCGRLDADAMKEKYLMCNVFASPSSIENSPNSVGEAMILGVPVVSSDVGGVHNMLSNEREGILYPHEEVSLLAEGICRIFSCTDDEKKREKLETMCTAARSHALKTHDPKQNYHRVLEIYHEINLCV